MTARAPLVALATANFTVGTGMLIVPGMLNELAAAFDVSASTAGQLTGAFALAVAFCAPVLAIATSRFDRRSLIVATLVFFALMHVGAALAANFAMLLGLRFLAGLGPAIITPQSAAAASLMVPPTERAGAVAAIFLGFSIASVAGLPLGAYLGAHYGWQSGMLAVALLAIIAAVWVRVTLAANVRVQPLGWGAWLEVMRHRRIVLLVVLTVVHSAGQFTLFSYLAPVLRADFNATPGLISVLFGWFGLWGVIGNSLGVRSIARFGASTVQGAALGSMALGLTLWGCDAVLGGHSMPLAFVATALWGLGCFIVNGAQQGRLLALDNRLGPAAVALNSSAIYLGQALGAVIGGVVLAHGGSTPLAWVGVVLLGGAMGIWAGVRRA